MISQKYNKIQLFLIILSLSLCYAQTGEAIDCQNGNDSNCNNCYGGLWQPSGQKCQVIDCSQQLDYYQQDWCKSCNPSKPFYRNGKCIATDCYNQNGQIIYTQQYCQDCQDLNVRADKTFCTSTDCSKKPNFGQYNYQWCSDCEINKIPDIFQLSCVYDCFRSLLNFNQDYCKQCSKYKYLSPDKLSCTQNDCINQPPPTFKNPLWCYECDEKHYKYVSADKLNCVERYDDPGYSLILTQTFITLLYFML